MVKITALKCKHCDTTIFSRMRRDMRYCECRKIAIDGGFDYIKITGNEEDYDIVEFDLKRNLRFLKRELFTDWSMHLDRYGLLKEGEQLNL